ncbi:MAG: c-type cytochrome [Hylemonella sp.]
MMPTLRLHRIAAILLAVPAWVAAQTAAGAAAPATAVSGETMAHSCAACHGTQGRLRDELFMPLAGMPEAQFIRTMQDFRDGRRPSTLMGHVARGFSDADLQAMARYFARIPPEQTP